MTKLALLALTLLLLGPSTILLGVATLGGTPATAAVCTPGSLAVGPIPDSLTATTRNGETVTLNRQQLTHAATIITVGGQTAGVGREGVLIALMAALTESTLRMLANTSAYPESAEYPNDGEGSDHDSLGLFQMRPVSGWGTVAELMDPSYQARAFYGGPTGPNYPSPRGLLDIAGWQQLDPGEAAQAVEVSAYPDRYQNYQPVAEAILTALTRPVSSGNDGGDETPVVPETTRIVFPLPEGTWARTSPFGWRNDPITGERRFHAGSDFAAPDGTPIYAVADGIVVRAGYTDAGGGVIVIEHTVRGERVASMYVHMWAHGIHVAEGDTVTAGQRIGDVGSSGHSTGPHLHLQIHPGGADADPVNSDAWLTDHGAAESGASTAPNAGCAPGPNIAAPTPYTGTDPDELRDDPTSGGQITARMEHLLTQTRAAFPDSGWACWSPRPGTSSEHPLGRACDVTFGNTIGTAATGAALDTGWAMTNWLQANAAALGVEYLIWQGKIWSLARADEGWRPYNGGGMHDPSDITGGHYDHLHITVREGR